MSTCMLVGSVGTGVPVEGGRRRGEDLHARRLSGHQRTVDRPQSEAIICNHMQSEAISGHQRTVDRPQSEATRGNHMQSYAIRGNQWAPAYR